MKVATIKRTNMTELEKVTAQRDALREIVEFAKLDAFSLDPELMVS